MASDSSGKRQYRKAIQRRLVVDRDGLIRALKAFGFEATNDPDIFRREEKRNTFEQLAGARYEQTVSIKELENDPAMYRRTILGLCRRNPDVVMKLRDAAAKSKKRKPPARE